MPIYYRTYRSFDGDVRRRFRWKEVLKQELRILVKNRTFLMLLILGYLHVIARVLQVVAMSIIASNPNNQLATMLRGMAQLEMFSVNEGMFFNFLRLQSPIMFLTILMAGSGMICDDFRNNLMEIFFSKPLNWLDYILGKVMTLMLIGLTLTAVPAIFLVILHNILTPSWETLGQTYWLPWPIIVFSLALVVPAALAVLASSALLGSQRYASVGVFMVLFGDLMLGRMLPTILNEPNYNVVAFPLAVNRIGEVLFNQKRPLFDLSWQWSAVFIAVVCGLALWIICTKIQRAEVAE